jgi:hypothetical protein
MLAMSEETLMIFPCLLLERAGRKYFDVRKGPLRQNQLLLVQLVSKCSVETRHGTTEKIFPKRCDAYNSIDSKKPHQILCSVLRKEFFVPEVINSYKRVNVFSSMATTLTPNTPIWPSFHFDKQDIFHRYFSRLHPCISKPRENRTHQQH